MPCAAARSSSGHGRRFERHVLLFGGFCFLAETLGIFFLSRLFDSPDVSPLVQVRQWLDVPRGARKPLFGFQFEPSVDFGPGTLHARLKLFAAQWALCNGDEPLTEEDILAFGIDPAVRLCHPCLFAMHPAT